MSLCFIQSPRKPETGDAQKTEYYTKLCSDVQLTKPDPFPLTVFSINSFPWASAYYYYTIRGFLTP